MGDIYNTLLDWPAVRELIRSESADPHRLLGPHLISQGVLIQAFIPTAVSITVCIVDSDAEYPMALEDAAGFFAVLLPLSEIPSYRLRVTYDNGTEQTLHDPYVYTPQITETDLRRFDAGVFYNVYEKLGAHPMEINGVSGTYFAVWAPCARRVSVVGDFNLWDGRRHPMRRLGDHGVFELFLPGIAQGTIYKYEVKAADGTTMLKADPYGVYAELRPHDASVVWDTTHYQWHDQAWMEERAARGNANAFPMSIYEAHLGSWLRGPAAVDGQGRPVSGSEFTGYRELAVKLAAYVREMGYTHVELLPVMEHPLDASLGYQVTGYYAPTSRFGSPDDFQYFMDYLHGQGIGVILDWAPAQFPRNLAGLANFDGSCVYEHKDPRQGTHPQWGTLVFNYGRPQVSNFLISNALYWGEVYHADGIRVDSAAAMLYLDYGRSPGQWIPNIYGGNENLEAAEFLRRLCACVHGRKDGMLLVAEESAAWPRVTGDADDALGFDYKWNNGWLGDFLGYMRYDPYFRYQRYGALTFSMLYAYSEAFILALPHHEMSQGRGSMADKMPGNTLAEKLAHLRAAYGYWMTHPGRKLLFMGQDMGIIGDWNESGGLPWEMLTADDGEASADALERRRFRGYVKALQHFYRSHPSLYKLDDQPEGFEWIDCMSGRENILVYLRHSESPEETLLVICNFAPVLHAARQIGAPFSGRYEEIFNSDDAMFGGGGVGNPTAVLSRREEWDGRENSITVCLAPLGVHIFSCTPIEDGEATG